MPWQETDAMKERIRFITEWERMWNETQGCPNMSALCRLFGISRQTGHKWVRRYREADHDLAALEALSRRPHHSPTKVARTARDDGSSAESATVMPHQPTP